MSTGGMNDPFGRGVRRRAALASAEANAKREALGLPQVRDGSLSKAMWRKCSPIRVHLATLGWTWSRLESEAGVTGRHLRMVANGSTTPTPEMVKKIAGGLGIEASSLWSQHLDWLSFQPSLDMQAIRSGSRAAKRSVHPIYRAMKARGMSTIQLSELSGMAKRTLQGYWAGEATPSLEAVMKVTEALDLNMHQLVRDLSKWARTFADIHDRDVFAAAAELEADLDQREKNAKQ